MALRFGRCRVLEHLKRVNMSQAEYARRIGFSESFVSKVISGEKYLSMLKAKMSADLFNCHIDDLYTWEYFSDEDMR